MEEILERLDVQLVPVPFDAVGIGWSVVDDEAAVSVVYHFADEDRASQAVEPLEMLYTDGTSLATQEPFSERFSVEDVEQDGEVVTVTVTPSAGGRPADLFQMWQQRELLFASR